MKEKMIPAIFYYYLYERVKETFKRRYVDKSDVATFLGNSWNIPKNLRPAIVKELETLGFITIINRDKIELHKPKVITSNISKVNRMVGLF